MVEPLILKRPAPVSGWSQVVRGVLFFGPVLVLAACWEAGRPIHVADPLLNLLVHLVLVVVPLIWAVRFSYRPLQVEANAELKLANGHYWTNLRRDWWMTLLLWAAPAFLLAAGMMEARAMDWARLESLSTSASSALLYLGIMFLVSAFYGVVLFERAEVRISARGIRHGLSHFYEWENLIRAYRTGRFYVLHHRAKPDLPAASFRLGNPIGQVMLEQCLKQAGIDEQPPDPAGLRRVELMVVLGFCLLLLVGWGLRYGLGWALGGSALIVFVLGLLANYALERFRGVAAHTRCPPRRPAASQLRS